MSITSSVSRILLPLLERAIDQQEMVNEEREEKHEN